MQARLMLMRGRQTFNLQEVLEAAFWQQEKNNKLIAAYGFLPFVFVPVPPLFVAELLAEDKDDFDGCSHGVPWSDDCEYCQDCEPCDS